jgi:hypothetical protein
MEDVCYVHTEVGLDKLSMKIPSTCSPMHVVITHSLLMCPHPLLPARYTHSGASEHSRSRMKVRMSFSMKKSNVYTLHAV